MTFHLYVDIVSYRYYGESKMHKVPNRFIQFCLASFYNITSFFLGVWYIPFFGFIWKLKFVGKAILKNVKGGYDYTHLVSNAILDDLLNQVWKSFDANIKQNLNKPDIEILLIWQTEYELENQTLYKIENARYLNTQINRGPNVQINYTVIWEFLNTLCSVREKAKEIS